MVPGIVGIKLGFTHVNIEGGSRGLLRPNLVIAIYPGEKCRSHTTVYGLSGILSRGIMFIHLSRSSLSEGRRNTFSRFPVL